MKYRKKPVVIDAWPWPEVPPDVNSNVIHTLKAGTRVVYTYCITSVGAGNMDMLGTIGITEKMYKKAPVLVSGKQSLAFYGYLHYNGILEVLEIEKRAAIGQSWKRYGYFVIPE